MKLVLFATLCLWLPGSLLLGGACGGEAFEEQGPDASPWSPDASPWSADASPLSADAKPMPAMPGAELGLFEMTYYWLAAEDEYSGPKVEELFAADCSSLAVVSASFADALRLEGAGRLSDGRLLNYEGSCSCANSPCFFQVDASTPWGLGVQNRALRPFRSIAVDTSRFAIGQGIYIKELDGLLMPGDADVGQYLHDGCVVADDIGGAIVAAHIDFFAGLREHYLVLVQAIASDTVTLHEGGERCLPY